MKALYIRTYLNTSQTQCNTISMQIACPSQTYHNERTYQSCVLSSNFIV